MKTLNQAAVERDADIANDDLGEIVSIKQDLADLVVRIRYLIDNGTFTCKEKDLDTAALAMEEQLDDLLYDDWHILTNICRSIAWPLQIPSKLNIAHPTQTCAPSVIGNYGPLNDVFAQINEIFTKGGNQ